MDRRARMGLLLSGGDQPPHEGATREGGDLHIPDVNAIPADREIDEDVSARGVQGGQGLPLSKRRKASMRDMAYL
jgi:hypothetical protein